MKRRIRNRALRARSGMTLIEVIVACTLLAITFTGLTAVAIKMGARTRSNAIIEQRTAIFFQEVNRLESMPYDSLTNARFLQTDSVKSGKGYYVWTYSVGSEQYSNKSGVLPYRDVTLTVTPRLAPTAIQTGTIRRSRSPFSSAINSGA
ncbi:MAG: type II secretion system protein [Gemmatimonadetes bacterium]|nr:type II secretion system protein [Gemmatimonadota bacterium]